MKRRKIAIVGGGAAGIMAAIIAARNGASVTVYESNDRIGKKILATGNGRCNLTNVSAEKQRYHGKNTDFITYTTEKFWVGETLDFFSELGLLYKVEDEGKVYPYSNHATSVLDVLRFELDRLGVKFEFGFEVKDISKNGEGFTIISYKSQKAIADKVIITTGGKASPSSGSKGGGYELLESFGHKITNLFPSLVQIKLKTNTLKQLNGLKIDGVIAAKEGKKIIRKEKGEILFTDYGISGPAVFSISRIAGEKKECVFEIDMMPEYSFDDIVDILKKQRKIMKYVEELFVGVLNKRIGQVIIKSCTELKMNDDINKITDDTIKNMASKLKNYQVISDGTMSWNNAQVTAGGVETDGFCDKTMESKLVKGIYAAGEVLDIDGDCGGYNLQWAWSSGYFAGFSASKEN